MSIFTLIWYRIGPSRSFYGKRIGPFIIFITVVKGYTSASVYPFSSLILLGQLNQLGSTTERQVSSFQAGTYQFLCQQYTGCGIDIGQYSFEEALREFIVMCTLFRVAYILQAAQADNFQRKTEAKVCCHFLLWGGETYLCNNGEQVFFDIRHQFESHLRVKCLAFISQDFIVFGESVFGDASQANFKFCHNFLYIRLLIFHANVYKKIDLRTVNGRNYQNGSGGRLSTASCFCVSMM